MNRNPTATLWLCAYGGVTVATHLAIVRELMGWPNLTHHVKGGDANIDRARSKVASWFLQEPEDDAGSVLLMVDADNAWMPGDLAHIAKRALERNAVVGGVYPKRAFNAGAALRVDEAAEGEFTIGTDALIPAAFVGTGFIAIPRTILAALSQTLPQVKGGFWPFFLPLITAGNEYTTDDWGFCERVRAAGFEVLASAYPHLTHEGTYTYRMVDSAVKPPEDRDVTVQLQRERLHV